MFSKFHLEFSFVSCVRPLTVLYFLHFSLVPFIQPYFPLVFLLFSFTFLFSGIFLLSGTPSRRVGHNLAPFTLQGCQAMSPCRPNHPTTLHLLPSELPSNVIVQRANLTTPNPSHYNPKNPSKRRGGEGVRPNTKPLGRPREDQEFIKNVKLVLLSGSRGPRTSKSPYQKPLKT